MVLSVFLADELDFLLTDGAILEDELIQKTFFQVPDNPREARRLTLCEALEALIVVFAHTYKCNAVAPICAKKANKSQFDNKFGGLALGQSGLGQLAGRG